MHIGSLFLLALFTVNLSSVRAADVHPQVRTWMDGMSVRQKIAQMCVIPVSSKPSDPVKFESTDTVIDQILSHEIGGVICFRGDIASQVALLTRLQNEAMEKFGIPLLVSQDAEWGPAMRLTDMPRLPKNMTLGAIQNKLLLRECGQLIGAMCRDLGVHMNYAPVVDVNTNPANPVIGMRAFHEDPHEVAVDAEQMIKGMLDENIMPCIKHAPGHGDTSKDSHTELPVIAHDAARLKQVELYPYEILFAKFDDSIATMVAHVVVPAFTKDMRPASLSYSIVQTLLRKTLGFRGLIVTDALNMKAITSGYTPRQAARDAFVAGNDILLYVQDVQGAIDEIEAVVLAHPIYLDRLDGSVARILELKRKIIEDERVYPRPVTSASFAQPEILDLKRRLYEESITLVRDEQKILPLKNSFESVGYIKIGGARELPPQLEENFPGVATRYLDLSAPDELVSGVLNVMQHAEVIIVALGRVHEKQSPYGNVPEVSENLMRMLARIRGLGKPVVLSVLTSPYALKFFHDMLACVEAYEDDHDAELGALKAIFGEMPARGRLPIKM